MILSGQIRNSFVAGLHLLLPLAAGGLVYACYRPGTYAASWWTRFTGCPAVRPPNGLVRILLDVLPDFLWSYSLAYFLLLYFAPARKKLWSYCTGIAVLLLHSEIIQLFFPSYFTFDYLDLSAGMLALVFATYYYQYQNQ